MPGTDPPRRAAVVWSTGRSWSRRSCDPSVASDRSGPTRCQRPRHPAGPRQDQRGGPECCCARRHPAVWTLGAGAPAQHR